MPQPNKSVQFQNLSLIDYQRAWDVQERLFAEIIAAKVAHRYPSAEAQQPTPNYLLFCEHPPVYTMGKSGKPDHFLLDETALEALGATFYRIQRGGDVTFHGPGQLVGYPIFDLENFFTDIHRYMRTLEETILLTCRDYGLDAGRIPGLTGVWLDYAEGAPNPRKICALGVRASRWVTMHGFAFNVNTNLRYFDHIVPCGIVGKGVTSLAQELGAEQDMPEVARKVLRHLSNLFGLNLLETAAIPLL